MRVTFELAKRLKDAGLNITQSNLDFLKAYSDWTLGIPKLSDVCDWLRNEKGLHCYTVPRKGLWDCHIRGKEKYARHTWGILYWDSGKSTHDEALIAAITRALYIIHEKTTTNA